MMYRVKQDLNWLNERLGAAHVVQCGHLVVQ